MIILIHTVCPQAEGGCGRTLILPTDSRRRKQRVPASCKCGKRWQVTVEHLKTEDNYETGKVQSYDQLTFEEDGTLVFSPRELKE